MDRAGKIILGVGIAVFVILGACILIRLLPLHGMWIFYCLNGVVLITALVMAINDYRDKEDQIY